MRYVLVALLILALAFGVAMALKTPEQKESWDGCAELHLRSRLARGSLFPTEIRPIAAERRNRFLGKPSAEDPEVQKDRLLCRGGRTAYEHKDSPWADWSNYWGAGDARSLPKERFPWSLWPGRLTGPKSRGVKAALIDLEYQRMELIKFNLFDNYTYETYVSGRPADSKTREDGSVVKAWPEMRLPEDHGSYAALEIGEDGGQLCAGDLIRHRTLTGICNDIENPRMGSTDTVFARNMQFETTFPDQPLYGADENRLLLENRHGGRIGLLTPDPQVVSRKLLTRKESPGSRCNDGRGALGKGGSGLKDDSLGIDSLTVEVLEQYSVAADCGYQKANSMNVMAAFWIQFMNHDWFSHLEEGHNAPERMAVGCEGEEAEASGCRPGDEVDRAFVEDAGDPATFRWEGREHLTRAPKTFRNTVTSWWDASQIYGYDEVSRRRVKRDPEDPAKLLMVERGDHSGGYLPLLESCDAAYRGKGDDCVPDPINPGWAGQEATAFAGNFTIGLSFYHNVFAREHNLFVAHFRARDPEADSGLRHPDRPQEVIRYADVTDDDLFEVARLVVAAEIAKIHTIEWTTQLLYNEPLYEAMNANWNGLIDKTKHKFLATQLERMTTATKNAQDPDKANQWYSVFASGPGIFGLGSELQDWAMTPEYVNGGINHFGSPFNFPEEFVTVYRLHPLLPDLVEFRELDDDPDEIKAKVPIADTFGGGSARAMTAGGMPNWALSLGRQRLGGLALNNHPRFLQNLKLERLPQELDIAALDLIRDRERGVPRYNEFRRQYGLLQITSFDDFADDRLKETDPEAYAEQLETAGLLREVYGRHRCDASKVITAAQVNPDGSPIDDCLGHEDGDWVDNVEDVDAVVGWLAEFRRPHGFAISETQFAVFILNASRRLFSDRFFTSSFRPEFYSYVGHDWVQFNGPCAPEDSDGKGRCVRQQMAESNGHPEPISPMKRVLLRTIPELETELQGVVNVFDPWTRDRGEYYSLDWAARPEARGDEAFSR